MKKRKEKIKKKGKLKKMKNEKYRMLKHKRVMRE